MSVFAPKLSSKDSETLQKFVSKVFQNKPDEEEIFYSAHSEALTSGSSWPHKNYDELKNSNDMVHYCISTVFKDEEGQIRRRKENFAGLYVIVLDDIGTKVKENDLTPSYIIETSAGNYQWGYILKEPIRDVELADELIKTIYQTGTGLTDTGGAQVTKLVKLPIGRNLKAGRDDFTITLHELNDLRYDWTELVEAWGLVVNDSSGDGLGSHSNATDYSDELFDWLKERSMVGKLSGDFYDVECPRSHEHTDQTHLTAGYAPWGSGSGKDKYTRGFNCFHAHNGKSPKITEFLDYCATLGGPKVGVTMKRPVNSILEKMDMSYMPRHYAKDNGKVVYDKTIDNMDALFDWYGIDCEYDVYSKNMMFSINSEPDEVQSADTIIEKVQSATINNKWEWSIARIQRYAINKCYENPSNAVLDWLESLFSVELPTVDDPINKVFDHLSVEEPDNFKRMLFRKWLIQCCAAIDGAKRTANKNAKPKYESILVFCGDQGAGKTKFFKNLLPENLSRYVATGLTLDPSSADGIRKATCSAITELGELDATFRRSDISHIKAFLSCEEDTYRLPYATDVRSYPRRTSYCASVNDTHFLQDSTGNRRYWTLAIADNIQLPTRELMDAAMLEAYVSYLKGEEWWLSRQDEIKAVSYYDQFHSHHDDPMIDKILARFGELNYETMYVSKDTQWMRVSEMLDISGVDRYTKGDIQRIGNYIKTRVSVHEKRFIYKTFRNNVRKFLVPSPKTGKFGGD